MNTKTVSKEDRNAAQRVYYKEWRAKNKDKVKKHNENFWAKKAAEMQQAEKNGK